MRTENRASSTQRAQSAPTTDPVETRKLALHLLETASKDPAPQTILGGGSDFRSMRDRLLQSVYPRAASLSKDDENLLTRATVVVVNAYKAATKGDAKSVSEYREACRWARDDLAWARAYVGLTKVASKALVSLRGDTYERVQRPETPNVLRQAMTAIALDAGRDVAMGAGITFAELLRLGNAAYGKAMAGAPAKPSISTSA